ncbi:MAG TPA: hypothetical protein VKS21_04495, partial [Spirochaetota bacterium]|nr:hypothetical protein [Spirochaetota bacterium]
CCLTAEPVFRGRFYQQFFTAFNRSMPGTNTNSAGSKYNAFSSYSALNLLLLAQSHAAVKFKGDIQLAYTCPAGSFLTAATVNDLLSINTLALYLNPGDFKISIGRFLPQWGVNKVFRPLDIFQPQTFLRHALSFTGIDALSVKYYINNLSSAELLMIPAADWSDCSLAARLEAHIGSFDLGVVSAYRGAENYKLLGLSFQGDILIGLSGEIYYRFNNPQDFFKSKDVNIFKSAFRVDYSFAKYFFIAAEYFYDSSGKKNYKNYSELLSAGKARMTLAEHYLAADFNILTYNKLNFGVSGIVNLNDNSFIFYPYFKYEILNGLQAGFSVYLFQGRKYREFNAERAGMGRVLLNLYGLFNF